MFILFIWLLSVLGFYSTVFCALIRIIWANDVYCLLMCSVLVKPSTSFLFRLLLTAGLILCGFSLSICLCGSGGRGGGSGLWVASLVLLMLALGSYNLYLDCFWRMI